MNVLKKYDELFSDNINLLFFDLETTGLNKDTDRIIEIAALRVEKGEVVKKLSTLVNPGIRIPYRATEVHGITNDMLVNEISDVDGVNQFLDMTDDCYIVAHNVNFDVGFINSYLNRMNKAPLGNKLVDTVKMSRKAFPGHSKYSLGIIAERLGIKVESAHRAEDDARVCYNVYTKCLEKLTDLGRNFGN